MWDVYFLKSLYRSPPVGHSHLRKEKRIYYNPLNEARLRTATARRKWQNSSLCKTVSAAMRAVLGDLCSQRPMQPN